jgi:diaminopropionate ammonia-lyase
MTDATYIANRSRREHAHRAPRTEVMRWHAQLPYYAPTPLVSLDDLAARLGFERIWIKDEGNRCGTTSFKIIGASWALHAALEQRGDAGRACDQLLARVSHA